MKIKYGFAGWCLSFALVLPSAHARIESKVFMGKTLLNHHTDKPTIVLPGGCPSDVNPMVHKIQLRVRLASATIDHLVIEFQSGGKRTYSIRQVFGRHTNSNWMDLPGGYHCIKSVDVIGETNFPRSRRAEVQLWGLN